MPVLLACKRMYDVMCGTVRWMVSVCCYTVKCNKSRQAVSSSSNSANTVCDNDSTYQIILLCATQQLTTALACCYFQLA